MKDSLGDRIKEYETAYRIKLPRRTYAILRIDGKSFHTWTKGLDRPFDNDLIQDMDETAKYLCKNLSGAKFAYVQSDEISILLTDFDAIGTQAWFDNNVQKMVSVAASTATAIFNELRSQRFLTRDAFDNRYVQKPKLAMFDARIFIIPQRVEVSNYFIWRQQDCTRNSISSVAQSLYPHKELHGVNSEAKQELIFQKGINWNDYPARKKRGGFIERITFVNGQDVRDIPNQEIALTDTVRNKWVSVECPIFTQEKTFLDNRIPENK